MPNTSSESLRLTPVQWLICIIAVIGFAFDTYELLMLPLIFPDAMREFLGSNLQPQTIDKWRNLMFYVPAVCGGVFGLLGGYLTDRLGRRRVLTWSILVYAFSALAAGFATSLPMLLVLRCTTFIGVCVEFVAAVAWLAELFPNPKQREAVLGYTQAFSSFGGLMVATAYGLAVNYAPSLPAISGGHQVWRYTLISGVIPALPLIIIRPFLPESPAWQAKKTAGTLKRPSLAELFRPEYRRTTIVAALMFACSLGVAFGAIQQLPQLIPGLPEAIGLPRPQQQTMAKSVQQIQEIGGLVGRFALAVLALLIISRRRLLRVFLIPGLILTPLVFIYPATSSLVGLKWGIFFVGFLAIAQLSFWGNYLPRVYPIHLRGTGESFAANVGGRMIGVSAVLLTTLVKGFMPGSSEQMKLAYAAAVVAFLLYALGLVMSFFLPEPKQEELPE
ncbi:MAG: MFS transporter [Blastocatellales bacterium]